MTKYIALIVFMVASGGLARAENVRYFAAAPGALA
jgi:hypothetical protein